MDDFAIARALHILAIVMWVGGVAFVTTVATPAIRTMHPPSERLRAFHQFESRFVWQARFWVLLAGASGLWMTWRAELWARFEDPRFWWMHAMFGVWAAFMIVLFVIEPLVLHRRLRQGLCAHLAHGGAPVDLHRDLAERQIARHLLVHLAGGDQRHDLTLARR